VIIRFIRSAVWVVVVVICAALYAMGEAASGQTTNGVVVAGASEAAAPAAPAKKPKNTFALSRTRESVGNFVFVSHTRKPVRAGGRYGGEQRRQNRG